ncbi:transforming acidic coiled-coil-containing protein 3 isoform X1 [Esox lucius]|uniref:transforming acidic coiled-coil-containing protein 3 isoform X1 n=1 Tax=Esox lucius TaxID=8010 RepID=UPI0014768784|nr:transforming acidic coiled-coil-containing protein 3 isoform X1 [Esox lucius]
MSSTAVNDENRGVCPGRKHSNSETSCDIFSLDQPTGRPSILRQSQAENLSNKTTAKGGKVCFQTPRRDPVTKRIVSPTKSVKMACDNESLHISTTEYVLPQEINNLTKSDSTAVSSYPDDEMPIQSKGGYQIDFDNLDSINPFQVSAKMVPSPAGHSEVVEPQETPGHNELDVIETVSPLTQSDKIEMALDETLPFIPSAENSFGDISTSIQSSDSSVITMIKDPANELSNVEEFVQASVNLNPEGAAALASEGAAALASEGAAALASEGAAALASEGAAALASEGAAALASEGAAALASEGAAALASEGAAALASEGAAALASEGAAALASEGAAALASEGAAALASEGAAALASEGAAALASEGAAALSNGSYKLDFDDLDSINPFQTGGSKIQNSPILGRKLPCDAPPRVEDHNLAVKEMEPATTVAVAPVVQEALSQAEMKPAPKEASRLASDPLLEPSTSLPKDGPVKLEFNFDDDKVKRRPMPKKFGKRTVGVKAVPAEKREPAPPKESPLKPVFDNNTEVPVPVGSYSFESTFDDPNFNPFGANAKMVDSPVCQVKSIPHAKATTSVTVVTSCEDIVEPVQNQTAPLPCVHDAGEEMSSTDAGFSNIKVIKSIPQDQKFQMDSCEVQVSSVNERELLTKPDQPSLSPQEPFEQSQFEHNSQNGVSEFEEFVPGTTFMANDFDGEMDYLEQFGSSNFKESALRKQSLYLKFDPLLRESPKKSGAPAGLDLPRIPPVALRMDTQRPGTKDVVNGLKSVHSRILDVPPPVHVVGPLNPFVQNSMFENMDPNFPPPANTDDNIIEVLKYSQWDMDAAIAKIQKEAKEREDEWKAKYEKLSLDNHEMGKIMSEFEATISQILAEKQKEKEMAQAEITQVLQEKEQVSQDLSAMERSFSDLFKRLDKYKEVIEGYKQNEEMLKKCAQDYLARIKKEEQRYQTLKAHAEQKIGLANKEIAEVRSKLKSEVSALQAQLRREQLKAQSLENSLDQKVKETEELTNLCDELIAKVQKG